MTLPILAAWLLGLVTGLSLARYWLLRAQLDALLAEVRAERAGMAAAETDARRSLVGDRYAELYQRGYDSFWVLDLGKVPSLTPPVAPPPRAARARRRPR